MSLAPRRGLTAATFAATGLLFLAYPVLRPDETRTDVATAFASDAWITAHLSAVAGFILVALGVAGLRDILAGSAGARFGRAATVSTWVGAGLTLPYYGAEIFGVNAMARAVTNDNAALLEMVDSFRYHPAAITTFALGLALLGVGAVLAAVAIGRSGMLPTWSGALFALGFALFIPQFFTPMPVRIAHGVLLAAGCLWVAAALWRPRSVAVPPAVGTV